MWLKSFSNPIHLQKQCRHSVIHIWFWQTNLIDLQSEHSLCLMRTIKNGRAPWEKQKSVFGCSSLSFKSSYYNHHKHYHILSHLKPESLKDMLDLPMSWQVSTDCPSQHPSQSVQKLAGGPHLPSVGLTCRINRESCNWDTISLV